MSTGAILPIYRWAVFQDGIPVPGAKLYTKLSGTDTDWPVYSDSSLSTERTNPVVADADGVFPICYLDAVAYRMEVTDANGVTVYPEQDNIYDFGQLVTGGTGETVAGTAGQDLTANQVIYLSDGSGALTAGRWFKADADQAYSCTEPSIAFVVANAASGAALTAQISGRMTGFTGLTAGATYYVSGTAGAITATPPALARIVGQADSTTSLIVGPNPPLGVGVAAGSDTEVQYNDGGAFGADAGFTFDGTTLTVPAASLTDGQLTFPATQNPSSDANTLDDYEENTCTLVIGGSGGTSGQSYSTQTANYVKIGRQVTVWFSLILSTKGTITGDVIISGLPFTAENVAAVGTGPVYWNTVTSFTTVIAMTVPNTTAAVILAATAADTTLSTIATADLDDSSFFKGSITYRATA